MTYLHYLHQINMAMSVALPALITRYRSISRPDTTNDPAQDALLEHLVLQVRSLNAVAMKITNSLQCGVITESDEVDEQLLG